MGPIVDVQNYTFTWLPIDEFNRTDADVTLDFLVSNSVYYDEPNDDPIFGAHQIIYNYTYDNGEVAHIYISDYYVSVIGCVEQYQVCQPDQGTCTALDATSSLLSNAAHGSVSFYKIQIGAIERIFAILASMQIYNIMVGRGASGLQVRNTLANLEQGALPNNQWEIEVLGWARTALARLQEAILEYPSQATTNIPGSYIYKPTDWVSEAMCHSQLVRQTNGTISFSVLGLSIILVVGFLIIALSLCIESVTGHIQTRYLKSCRFRWLDWILDEKFQLQRMMYEAADMGGEWKNVTDEIPTTREDHRFGG
ncbi:hypothetical protein UCRPC4_g04566 [Phaeomoniella chlamydospora]|uniref:Uncharacterized protein n=1 Tax=Phaeomoniella chlamydospora TaxID=158046 RepID=A0A0G2E858_PHACM|nr:hypothetical protein UCRPC4_g04566 [Phaeomoniella chlamydospora]